MRLGRASFPTGDQPLHSGSNLRMVDRLRVELSAFGELDAIAGEVGCGQDDLDRRPALADRRCDLDALAAARHIKVHVDEANVQTFFKELDGTCLVPASGGSG